MAQGVYKDCISCHAPYLSAQFDPPTRCPDCRWIQEAQFEPRQVTRDDMFEVLALLASIAERDGYHLAPVGQLLIAPHAYQLQFLCVRFRDSGLTPPHMEMVFGRMLDCSPAPESPARTNLSDYTAIYQTQDRRAILIGFIYFTGDGYVGPGKK